MGRLPGYMKQRTVLLRERIVFIPLTTSRRKVFQVSNQRSGGRRRRERQSFRIVCVPSEPAGKKCYGNESSEKYCVVHERHEWKMHAPGLKWSALSCLYMALIEFSCPQFRSYSWRLVVKLPLTEKRDDINFIMSRWILGLRHFHNVGEARPVNVGPRTSRVSRETSS